MVNEVNANNSCYSCYYTESILNSITNAALVIDNNYVLLYVNEATSNLFFRFGYNKDLVGADIRYFANKVGWDIDGILDNLYTRKQEGIETLFNKNGNENTILQIGTAPILNRFKQTIGVLITVSDITEYKNSQEDQAQKDKMAILGQMGAGIVHETKNYLAAIKGSSQILKLIAKDAETLKYAEKINQSVDEVNKIICGFLNLARPNVHELKNMSINELVGSLKLILEPMTILDGIELDFIINAGNEKISCDEGSINQVFLNIIKNAVEAVHINDNPSIKIESGVHIDSEYVFISVSDNGAGIPESIINKIGTPFFTTKVNGTGLGLNMCYKILKDHGGNMEIESSEGAGTTFKVILPRVKQQIHCSII